MKNIYKLNSKRKRIVFVLLCFLIIYALIILYVFLNKNFNLVIPCLFHKLTNLYCPGCGITRAVISLSKLHFYDAFRYNALVVCLLPLFTIYYWDKIIAWINQRKPLFAHEIPNYFWYILLGITIIFGILRNIPSFDYLTPIG